MIQYSCHFVLGGINLDGVQTFFKVIVGYKSITILIEFPESLEKLDATLLTKDFVLNLGDNLSNSLGVGFSFLQIEITLQVSWRSFGSRFSS